jgi:Protein of unknown function (DUF2905)
MSWRRSDRSRCAAVAAANRAAGAPVSVRALHDLRDPLIFGLEPDDRPLADRLIVGSIVPKSQVWWRAAAPASGAKGWTMSRFLIVLGLVILALGLLWPVFTRLGLGRLPGDIVIQRDNFTFYFPLATCILASLLLSAVFWLFNR